MAKVRRGAGAVLVAAAALWLGCGASGRVATLPPGFAMPGGDVPVRVILGEDKPTVGGSAPLLSAGNQVRLTDALRGFDWRAIVSHALPGAIPADLSGVLTPAADAGAGAGGLALDIEVDAVETAQDVVGADWYLRFTVFGVLRDGSTGAELWRFDHREGMGRTEQGRVLVDLTVDELVDADAARLRVESEGHMAEVLVRVLADLDAALKEPAGGPDDSD